ncbi:MAG: hypothetical protein EOL87_03530 [Spartobacteria bacterium]|nr:hypothetical protein [Spartobacteria bacterium]
MKYVIGVDVGTQGTKTAMFTQSGGNVAETLISSRLIYTDDGGIEQSADEIYQSVVMGIRRVLQDAAADPQDVVAVGMSGQMAGVMGIDDAFNPVGNYDSWLDTRCAGYIDELKAFGEKRIIQITGAPVSFYHAPRILRCKKERPEDYARIAKFVMPTAFVAGKMCGLKAADAFVDYTYLHFAGFADTQAKCWSDELLTFFGIDASKMPRIIAPFDIVGEVSEQGALDSGLCPGTKIIAGCGDTAATILGAGGYHEGVAVDIAGTASVLAMCTKRYTPDDQSGTLICARSVIDGLWAPMAYVAGGGQCLAWFNKQIVQDEAVCFDHLEKEAMAVNAGSEGLLFVPHFTGRTCPYDARVRGSWMNLKWNHQRGHLFRSIMESVAYEYRLYADILMRKLPEFSFQAILGVGGGTNSALFNQIKADALGCSYVPMQRADSAVLATAVMAGFAVGIFSDITGTIDQFTLRGTPVQNNPDNKAVYAQVSKKYYALLNCMKDLPVS